MTYEIKPQVGDVWEDNETGNRKEAKAVANDSMIYSYDGDHVELTSSISAFNEMNHLALRNGKPYKPKIVFEDGAYYPVVHKVSGEVRNDVAKFYKKKRSFLSCTWFQDLSEDQLYWIGEKLEIDWLEDKN